MGLLKACIGALSGVLADSWRDYFYCESMDADTLVVKGEKRTGGRSSNKKGTDNIISNGSIINVNDGQCMIIVESGKVVEICAEPGEFVYDTGTEPSISMAHSVKTLKRAFLKLVSVLPLEVNPQKTKEFTTSTQRKLWEISTVHLLLFLSELWIRLSDSHLILKSVATVSILTELQTHCSSTPMYVLM
jgi:hypothetical protein